MKTTEPISAGQFRTRILLVAALCLGLAPQAAQAVSVLVAWGDNTAGQTNVPLGLTNVLAIAAGGSNCLVRLSDNSVVAWGANHYGQATPPPGLSDVGKVAVGGSHCLGLRGGSLRQPVALGPESSGQTNIPFGASSSTVAIAAGGYHCVGLTTDRRVVAWGAGTQNTGVHPHYGQSQPPPSVATYGSEALAIAAGRYHSLARRGDGQLIAWGAGKTTPACHRTMAKASCRLEYPTSLPLRAAPFIAWCFSMMVK